MVERSTGANGNKNSPSEVKGSEKPAPDRTITDNALLSNKTLPTQAMDTESARIAFKRATPGQTKKPVKMPAPIVGKVIEKKFKVIREIGGGAMGVVYEAEHLQLRKRFAIKCIRAEYTKDPDFNKRFDREAKTQALLQHPNIIQVTDFIKENGQFFMVMEHVQGHGLDALIKEKKISEEEMLSIFKDVLKGLGHAHRKGLLRHP